MNAKAHNDVSSRITRRKFLGKAAAAGAWTLLGSLPANDHARARQVKRPNIVFVFSDQHSYDMLGCYGNEQIITPNLDRFASQGVQFSHCVSSCPVCTPYRSMLLSGQHPLYNGAFVNDVRMLPGNGKYFGEVLRDAGYRTGYVGKWHLYGGNRNRPVPRGQYRYGFDGLFLTDNCTEEFRPERAYYWDSGGGKVTYDEWEPYGQTRQAMRFLDKCSEDEPFALFVSWHPPHNMGMRDNAFFYGTEPELMAEYDPAKIRLRPNCEDTPGNRLDYQGYMAMCTGIDTAFGWLMDKLKERGLDENTIVVYTSDHGDMLHSNNRPWPKTVPEDESVRVPLMIRWPKNLKPRKSDLIVRTLDLMPTLLAMLGIHVPSTCQGKDLSKAVFTADDDLVDSAPLFMPVMGQGWRGMYTKRYTYSFDEARNVPVVFNCLYDRKTAPWQQNNLYGSDKHRTLQQKLHAQTLEWMEKFDDTFVPADALIRRCLGEEGLKSLVHDDGGVLSARPIDLLKSAKRS